MAVIKVRFKKTLQEVEYEPIDVEVEIEEEADSPDDAGDLLDKAEKEVDEMVAQRIEELQTK